MPNRLKIAPAVLAACASFCLPSLAIIIPRIPDVNPVIDRRRETIFEYSRGVATVRPAARGVATRSASDMAIA